MYSFHLTFICNMIIFHSLAKCHLEDMYIGQFHKKNTYILCKYYDLLDMQQSKHLQVVSHTYWCVLFVMTLFCIYSEQTYDCMQKQQSYFHYCHFQCFHAINALLNLFISFFFLCVPTHCGRSNHVCGLTFRVAKFHGI